MVNATAWTEKTKFRIALLVLTISVVVIADASWVLTVGPGPVADKYHSGMQLIVALIASCFSGYFVGRHWPD